MLLALPPIVIAFEEDEVISDYARKPALIFSQADTAVHLAATGSDGLLIIAGERGIVQTSTDRGATWTQASIPLDVTLTTAAVTNNGQIWIGGHEGTLLQSLDQGATWVLARSRYDGPPILRIRFFGNNAGFAVGGNGLVLQTTDAGVSWQQQQIFNADFFDPHLFDIAQLDQQSYLIAAEFGNLFRSTDSGGTWEPINSPYQGSFFGLVNMGSRGIVAYGMLSHAFHSTDRGDSWTALDSGVEDASFFSGHALPNGLALAGADGAFTTGLWQGEQLQFESTPLPTRSTVADLFRLTNGDWLLATDRGPQLIPQESR